MDILNDDCIIMILRHLDLQSQMIMLDVHPRFMTLMPIAWREAWKVLNLNLIQQPHVTLEKFQYLIESICKTVLVLKIKHIYPEKLEILLKYKFPKARDFRFSQRQPHFMDDTHIPHIIESFPNLRTFSPHGNYTGANFTDFEHLEAITLSYCGKKFEVQNFVKIMHKYRLKSLKLDMFEREDVLRYSLPLECMLNLKLLKVDCNELEWFESHLKNLLNLKELIVTYVEPHSNRLTNLCQTLYDGGRRDIRSIESCNTDKALATIFNSGLSFETLSVVTDGMLLTDTLHINFEQFHFVREIYFNVCVIGTAMEFSHLLYNIPQVELLSLEQCDCSFAMFSILAERLEVGRTTLFTLNLCRNKTSVGGKTEYVQWNLFGESPLVLVKEDLISPMSYEPIFIQFK